MDDSYHKVVPIRDIQEQKSKYFATFNEVMESSRSKRIACCTIYILPLFVWYWVKIDRMSHFAEVEYHSEILKETSGLGYLAALIFLGYIYNYGHVILIQHVGTGTISIHCDLEQ